MIEKNITADMIESINAALAVEDCPFRLVMDNPQHIRIDSTLAKSKWVRNPAPEPSDAFYDFVDIWFQENYNILIMMNGASDRMGFRTIGRWEDRD